MACRIDTATFLKMALEEAAGRIVIAVTDDSREAPMAHVVSGELVLHRKPIQALVDEVEEARPIIRNLIRWGLEQRTKARGL